MWLLLSALSPSPCKPRSPAASFEQRSTGRCDEGGRCGEGRRGGQQEAVGKGVRRAGLGKGGVGMLEMEEKIEND